jgi:hypothetical protein
MRYALWTVLSALALLYVVAVLEASRRFVWFDGLYTLDLARVRTIPLIWQPIRRFDLQPPAMFLLSRFSEYFGIARPSRQGLLHIGMAILLGPRLPNNRYAVYAAAGVLLVFCIRTDVLGWA